MYDQSILFSVEFPHHIIDTLWLQNLWLVYSVFSPAELDICYINSNIKLKSCSKMVNLRREVPGNALEKKAMPLVVGVVFPILNIVRVFISLPKRAATTPESRLLPSRVN